MSKQEFLQELRKCLKKTLSKEKADEIIEYYDAYIDYRKLEGFLEEEVMEELGNPRLIAKSILELEEKGAMHFDDMPKNGSIEPYKKMPQFANWWEAVLFILAILIIVCLILKIIGSILSIVTPFLVPILLFLIAIYFINRREE